VFGRGIVGEENLWMLRQRKGQYLVGTPRSKLKQFERELLAVGWDQGAQRCRSETGARAARRRDLHSVPLDSARGICVQGSALRGNPSARESRT
jgi:hypothetical protein